MNFISLIPITSSAEHVDRLYSMLSERSSSISHSKVPSLEEHQSFVLNHPYLAWYFIRKNKDWLGTCYVTDQNTIGVNAQFEDKDDFSGALGLVLARHSPLPEIKSVRAPNFIVNVAVENLDLQLKLTEFGAVPIQISFKLP